MAATAGSQGLRRTGPLVVGATLSVLGAVAALAGGAWALYRAIHVRGSSSHTREDLVLAGLAAILLFFCARWTMHAEHRLRQGNPAAASFSPSVSFASSLAFGSRSARRYSPLSSTVSLLIFVLVFAALAAVAISQYKGVQRSQFVQQHGISRAALVTGVDDVYHAQRYGGYYTSLVDVRLVSPFGAQTTTIVDDPNEFSLPVGARISVLIDPNEPSYSELPGAPTDPRSTWFVLVGGLVLMAVLILWALIRRMRIGTHTKLMNSLLVGGATASRPGSTTPPGQGPAWTDPAPGAPWSDPAHAPAWSDPAHAPAWSDPAHAPAWSDPAHAPAWSDPAHAPAWSDPAQAPAWSDPAQGAATGAVSYGAADPSFAGRVPSAGSGLPVGTILTNDQATRPDVSPAQPGSLPTAAAADLARPAEPAPLHPAAWHPDPYKRFRLRYWDGSIWTQWVSDGSGSTSTDPLAPLD